MPYFLRSRVPLGNASNLNGPDKCVAAKKQDLLLKAHKPKDKKPNVLVRVIGEADKNPVPQADQPPGKQKNLHGHQVQECAPPAFSSVLLVDVDSVDAGEYVKDIYTYLGQLEVALGVKQSFLDGQEVSDTMRSIVIDWLVQIHKQFKLQQETLYMAVGVLDRFLQVSPVTKKYLQLVAVTAMLISSKYEDIFPPTVEDCVYVTAYTYSCSDVCGMERVILKALNYSLGRPVPVHFLRRASKVGQVGPKEYGLAKYLMELTLLDYTLAHHPPSLIAAAAFALSLKVLKFGGWSPVLQHYTGYTESSLLPVMASIVQLLEGMHSGRTKHQFIKLKYESPRLLSVSCLSEISAFIKGR